MFYMDLNGFTYGFVWYYHVFILYDLDSEHINGIATSHHQPVPLFSKQLSGWWLGHPSEKY